MPRGVAVASIARLPSSTDDPSGSTADRHVLGDLRGESQKPGNLKFILREKNSTKRTLSQSTQVRHRYQKRHSLRRTFRRRRRPHGGGHDRGDSRIREHRSARRKDHPHHPNPPGDPLAACPASGHCATHPRALDRAPRQEHIASPPPDPRRRAESFPPSPAPSTPPCPATSWRQPIAPALRRNIPAPVPA